MRFVDVAAGSGPAIPLAIVVVLTVVNLLNNVWLPRLYVPTGIVGSVVLLALAAADGASLDDLGLAPADAVDGVIWGAGALGVVVAGYAIGLAIPATRRGFDDARIAEGGPGWLAYRTLVHIPIGTVVLEEIAFRAVLLAVLTSRVGLGWAIVWSSVLFGLWHVLPAIDMLESNAAAAAAADGRLWGRAVAVVLTVVGTGAAGVVFCGLRVVSGSLLAPMLLHWVLNSLGTILTWVRARWPAHR